MRVEARNSGYEFLRFSRKIGFAAIQEIAADDELGISPVIFGDTLEHAVDGRRVEGVVGCIGHFIAHHLAETDRLGYLVSQLGAKLLEEGVAPGLVAQLIGNEHQVHAGGGNGSAVDMISFLEVSIRSRPRMRLRPGEVRIGPGLILRLAMLDCNARSLSVPVVGAWPNRLAKTT